MLYVGRFTRSSDICPVQRPMSAALQLVQHRLHLRPRIDASVFVNLRIQKIQASFLSINQSSGCRTAEGRTTAAEGAVGGSRVGQQEGSSRDKDRGSTRGSRCGQQ